MAWKTLLWLCLMTLLWMQLSGYPLATNSVEHGVQPSVSDSATAYRQVSSYRKTSARALMDAIEQVFPFELSLRAVARPPCHKLTLARSLPINHLLSRDLVDIAMSLALGGLRCHTEVLPHILELYEDLGDVDATNLFLDILNRSKGHMLTLFAHTAPRPVTDDASREEQVVGGVAPALMYNVDQLAGSYQEFGFDSSRYRCTGLNLVNGSVLLGSVHSYHASLMQATSECRQLGVTCAGVSLPATGQFQVLTREGSYFLPKPGALSWLLRCKRTNPYLRRRSPPAHCHNEREQEVHNVMQWMPLASTYYNLGTTVYYAVQNCTELAKERAIEAALDLGYDAMVSLTGGATGIVGYGVAASLKPGVKATVQAVMDYFRRTDENKREANLQE